LLTMNLVFLLSDPSLLSPQLHRPLEQRATSFPIASSFAF
jgi:hypothetical protein